MRRVSLFLQSIKSAYGVCCTLTTLLVAVVLTVPVELYSEDSPPAAEYLCNKAGILPGHCAKWISGEMPGRDNVAAPVLEKHFTLDRIPSRAILTLAVAGWHEVSVNGVRIGDEVLSPVTCQPDLRLSSVSREISGYLKKGRNTVSVLLGNGWFNCLSKDTWGFCHAPWNSAPMICGELIVDGKVLFVSGEGWIAYDSPIVFNALRNGEWYDARKEGCRENERKAHIVKYTPYAEISPEVATPCRVFDPIEPVCSFPAADGGRIYDFGTRRAGWCEIEVLGEAGAKVTIDYDECLSSTNTLLGKISRFAQYGADKDHRPFQHDEYTLAGRPGGERWHPRFTYHGFRYARVKTEGKATLTSIKSVFVHSAFMPAGSIETSDAVFSRLQDATRRSYLANYTGIPTDCPHREKNGWTGDTQLAMETGLWNFDAKDGYIHFLRMAVDTQRRNGQIPCILPCSPSFGYYWGSGPAYDAILFEIPWQIYRFYGDDSPAREAYGAMKKYLEFIATKARGDGLVEYGLGDWSAPKSAKVAPTLLTDSAYVYEFHRRVAFWAERFGEPDVARKCHTVASTLKSTFNRVFYKGRGVYADGELTSLAAPLYFDGLCVDGEESKVAAELLRSVREQRHKACFGILGAKWVPRALAKHGFIDDAWRLFTQPEVPGWAAWMKENDTLLESFDNDPFKESHIHIMFGDLSAWGYEYAAGIVPVEPGFKKVSIKPRPISGVDSFVAVRKTRFGDIRAGWKREGDETVLIREVPDGIELVEDFEDRPSSSVQFTPFKFLSFNIWGDYFNNPVGERAAGIEEAITKDTPDIVSLQEVTPNWYKSSLFANLEKAGYVLVRGDEDAALKRAALIGVKTDRHINHEPILYRKPAAHKSRYNARPEQALQHGGTSAAARMHGEKRDILKFGMAFCRKNFVVCKE